MAKAKEYPGNSAVAREALGEGLTSPSEATEWAKAKYGAVFNENSFKAAFSTLKNKDGSGEKRERKTATAKEGEPGLSDLLKLATGIKESGMSLDQLSKTMEKVEKLADLVGGYSNLGKAVEALKALDSLRG